MRYRRRAVDVTAGRAATDAARPAYIGSNNERGLQHMPWFDANDYFLIETAARDRVQDLEFREEAVTDRAALFSRADRPRKIDEIIDYFGECSHRALPAIGSVRCVSQP